jgi:hypothetical protein
VPANWTGTDRYSCAVCGDSPSRCVIIQVGARKLLKDLCQRHLDEVMAGAKPIQRADSANKGTTAPEVASVVRISEWRK